MQQEAVFGNQSAKASQRESRETCVLANGCVYEGQWASRGTEGFLPHGVGYLKRPNGEVYHGQMRDGLPHGHGTTVSTQRDNDMFDNALVVEEWPDGAKYMGQYVDGKKHGFGKFVWADGSKYEGPWYSNSMHGNGCFSFADGRIFDGDYVLNLQEGIGVLKWPDGREYSGQWKGGKQHGHGSATTAKGEKRSGTWEDGRSIEWTGSITHVIRSDYICEL